MLLLAGPQAFNGEDELEFFQIVQGQKELHLDGAGQGDLTVRNDEGAPGADIGGDGLFMKDLSIIQGPG